MPPTWCQKRFHKGEALRLFRTNSSKTLFELGVRLKDLERVYKFGVPFGIRSALMGHRTQNPRLSPKNVD